MGGKHETQKRIMGFINFQFLSSPGSFVSRRRSTATIRPGRGNTGAIGTLAKRSFTGFFFFFLSLSSLSLSLSAAAAAAALKRSNRMNRIDRRA